MILRGVFLLTKKELAWFYQDGASMLFPDAWERFLAPIPPEEHGDLLHAYHRRLTGPDKAVRAQAAAAWSRWEGDTLSIRGPEARPQSSTRRTSPPPSPASRATTLSTAASSRRRLAADPDRQAARHPGVRGAGPLRRGHPHVRRLGAAQGVARSGVRRGVGRGARLDRARA